MVHQLDWFYDFLYNAPGRQGTGTEDTEWMSLWFGRLIMRPIEGEGVKVPKWQVKNVRRLREKKSLLIVSLEYPVQISL